MLDARDAQCWQCPQRIGLSLVCPHCEAPQPLPPDADLFTVLGLPRHLVIDPEELERRYHTASRATHPDRHHTTGVRAQELSLAASAAVNRAYRTLRDPVARGRYWLELHGRRLGDDNNRVPPALVALVFETQEQLETLRAAAGSDAALRRVVEQARDELSGRIDGLRNALATRYAAWDASKATMPGALDELRERLAEIAYLGTLLDDVEDALRG